MREYAAQITGVGAVEYVPDEFVRSGEVELVDVPAAMLRERIASGKVYSADLVGGALADYFRASNLEALSELGRAWVEGNAVAVGEDLLVRRGLVEPQLRPVVVAGVSGSGEDERVIRDACVLARQRRCRPAGRPRQRPGRFVLPAPAPGPGTQPGTGLRTGRQLHRGRGERPGPGARRDRAGPGSVPGGRRQPPTAASGY